MSKKTVFDCFSGIGGISIGAEMAGFRVIGGVDRDPFAIQTFSEVFAGCVTVCEDLMLRHPAIVLKEVGIAKGDVDLLVGGPPCQPFSVNNHHRSARDRRSTFVIRFMHFTKVLHPRWIVMENVPGLVSINEGRFFRSFIEDVRSLGYNVGYVVIDAQQFGVPQRRKRLVVIGMRDGTNPSKLLLSLLKAPSRENNHPSVSGHGNCLALTLTPTLPATHLHRFSLSCDSRERSAGVKWMPLNGALRYPSRSGPIHWPTPPSPQNNIPTFCRMLECSHVEFRVASIQHTFPMHACGRVSTFDISLSRDL